MRPEAPKYLWDALDAAQRLQRFVQGKGFADYLADELLRAAVERQFEIIGEALGQLRKADPDTAARIPDLPRMVGFRNVLIHAYATVDNRLVWGVVETHLDPLTDLLHRLLEEAGP